MVRGGEWGAEGKGSGRVQVANSRKVRVCERAP